MLGTAYTAIGKQRFFSQNSFVVVALLASRGGRKKFGNKIFLQEKNVSACPSYALERDSTALSAARRVVGTLETPGSLGQAFHEGGRKNSLARRGSQQPALPPVGVHFAGHLDFVAGTQGQLVCVLSFEGERDLIDVRTLC